SNNNVEFLGWQSPAAFFPLVDYLVFPTLLDEPFGRVVVEALSFGVPVIVSSRGGVPETLTPGVGVTFSPDDPGDLEKAIRYFTLDATSYASASMQAIDYSKRFAASRIVSEFDDFLARVLSATKRDPRWEWAMS